MRALRHDLPLLNALAVFEAAASHCNNTITAEALGIAQSAVSRHVSNLEMQTGLKLFERTGNRLALTPDGQRLSESISSGLGQIRDTIVSLQQKKRIRPYTIGCTYDLANLWLVPHFDALRGVLAHRQLRIITTEKYYELDDPDIDLSVRYGDGSWGSNASFKLFDEVIFPICSPRLMDRFPRLASGEITTVIEGAPLLESPRGLDGKSYWTLWLRKFGVDYVPDPEGDFPNYMLLLYEILAGRGVGLGWDQIVTPHIKTGQLVRLSDESLSTGNAFHAVVAQDRHDRDTVRVIECLRSLVYE